jgi:hypothetical protein
MSVPDTNASIMISTLRTGYGEIRLEKSPVSPVNEMRSCAETIG